MISFVAIVFLVLAPTCAFAGGNVSPTERGAKGIATGSTTSDGSPGGRGGPGRSNPSKTQPTYLPKAEYERQMKAARAEMVALLLKSRQMQAQWAQCMTATLEVLCGGMPGSPTIPPPPNIAIAGDPKPAAPAIPPEVIAYQAIAELKLTAPKPVVGPPPEINRWKTAVVGYPLWLSTAGNPNPPIVSDSVYDVSVSLQAHLQRVVFDMGDGHKISCTDTTHPWTRSVATNAKSPWCGYAYQEIPKHSKTYTITAYAVWSVDWQINGTTGTLPFYQQASIDLPVSELQVLVR